MPPAARLTDMHTCPMVTGLVPHVGGPILPPCCPTVLIGGLPAARMGDMATCVGSPVSPDSGMGAVSSAMAKAAATQDPPANSDAAGGGGSGATPQEKALLAA